MAEHDSEERTLDPSEKRLKEAREKGQVLRSREYNATLVLFTGIILLFLFKKSFAVDLVEVINRFYNKDLFANKNLDLLQMFNISVELFLQIILPFVIALFVIVLLASFIVGGFNFSITSVAINFDRLNPLSGLAKMFSLKSVVELFKAIIKVLLLFGIAWLVITNYLHKAFYLALQDIFVGLKEFNEILLVAMLFVSAGMVFVTLIDIPWQYFDLMKQLKMTRQEARDEHKEAEGRPEVKGKIRQMQKKLARGRMMSRVPQADAIITNPTHFAVAIIYEQDRARAPLVVAKGLDNIAQLIKKVAIANEVPIIESPALARALYYAVDLEEEIPQGLYIAVAQLLAYIYQLKLHKKGHRNKPQLPLIEVPDKFRRD